MLPGNGNRPRYTPSREPETPRGYGRREEYEGERGQRGRGKSVDKNYKIGARMFQRVQANQNVVLVYVFGP
jgi:hypothetical protein